MGHIMTALLVGGIIYLICVMVSIFVAWCDGDDFGAAFAFGSIAGWAVGSSIALVLLF
jgi:hypothetical protein